MKDYIIAGKILEPYGLKGLVKIISYMQNPKEIFQYQLHHLVNFTIKPVTIKLHSPICHQKFKCSIQGFLTRSDAEKINKSDLLISSKDLPKLSAEEFYIEDLIGLEVVNNVGKNIGIVKQVYNFGAGDVVEIKFNNNSSEMYDFNDQAFPKVSKGQITFIAPKIL
jgi:16S rRNA processing protein RimM